MAKTKRYWIIRFFAFNNALNKKGVEFIPYGEQATLLKSLGYDGIEHRETDGILELKSAFEKQGLKIFTDYIRINIDNKEEPYLLEWKEVIPKLSGTGIILWAHLHSEKYQSSDEAADK